MLDVTPSFVFVSVCCMTTLGLGKGNVCVLWVYVWSSYLWPKTCTAANAVQVSSLELYPVAAVSSCTVDSQCVFEAGTVLCWLRLKHKYTELSRHAHTSDKCVNPYPLCMRMPGCISVFCLYSRVQSIFSNESVIQPSVHNNEGREAKYVFSIHSIEHRVDSSVCVSCLCVPLCTLCANKPTDCRRSE